MLRPDGLMYVGLYSERARANIKAVRTSIAGRGLLATADNIRQCREHIAALPDGALEKTVVGFSDFYTIGECRDLLFHVQEHQHTLPQIAAFLSENGLTFLGFDLNPNVQQRYAERFPADGAMTDLANWHIFEEDNPDAFVGMYQFWVQRASQSP